MKIFLLIIVSSLVLSASGICGEFPAYNPQPLIIELSKFESGYVDYEIPPSENNFTADTDTQRILHLKGVF